MTIYHGSFKEITQFNDQPLWFAATLPQANEYVLAQDDYKSAGQFGYIYETEITDWLDTDDFNSFDDGSILKQTDAPVIRYKDDDKEYFILRNPINHKIVETEYFA